MKKRNKQFNPMRDGIDAIGAFTAFLEVMPAPVGRKDGTVYTEEFRRGYESAMKNGPEMIFAFEIFGNGFRTKQNPFKKRAFEILSEVASMMEGLKSVKNGK